MIDHTRTAKTLDAIPDYFRKVFENAAIGISIRDIEGRLLHCNPAYSTMLGYSAEEVPALGHNSLVHPDDSEANLQQIRRLQAGEVSSFEMENRLVRKDGRIIWVRKFVSTLPDASGRPAHLIALISDITERKQAEEALRESRRMIAERNRQLEALFEQAPAGLVRLDTEFRVLAHNRIYQELFEEPFRSQGLVGRRFSEFVPLAEESGAMEVLRKVLRTARGKTLYDRAYDGFSRGRTWWNWTVAPVTIDGEVVGLMMMTVEVTEQYIARQALEAEIRERRRTEQALRESESRFRRLADAMPQLVWTASDDGLVTYYNSRATDYDGIVQEHEGHWRWQPVVHPEDLRRTVAAWQAAVADASTYECEHRVRMKDGSFRWHLSRAYRVPSNGGVQWFGTATDIHQVKEAEEALREADRRKDQFLATLAHELRNPLAPIRNAVQLLKLRSLPDPTTEAARDIIDRQVQHMVRLIDDLLDVSRITSGKLELRRKRVSLAAVVKQALETQGPNLQQELVVSLPTETIYLNADPDRLTQVFSNLLNNASKFTPKGGGISVSAERDASVVTVRIRDTGMGIAPEHLNSVFEIFAQVGPAHERTQGGLGIGLSLTRALVEMHGGTIQASSEGPGKGSVFTVRLPILGDAPALPRSVPEARAHAMTPRRVLVADDNRDAADSLAMVLRLAGNEVEVAYDGVEAARKAESQKPDTVILDIGMPNLNGYAACRLMREQPWGKDAVIVALTGFGQEADRRMSKEAGFDAHLVKPLDYAALVELLAAPGTQSSERRRPAS